MSVRPLPGASYHTLDSVFFSFTHVDPEVADPSPDTTPSHPPSEKNNFNSSQGGRKPPINQVPCPRGRHSYRLWRPPVVLSVIVLCCLAFVASAIWEYAFDYIPLVNVPERHAPLAARLSAAFRTQPYRTPVNEYSNNAREMILRKLECSHDGCNHDVNLRHYLLQAFPLENLSIHHAVIGESAVVLQWQGTDSSLKPVLITNSDAVLDVKPISKNPHNSSSPCDEIEIDHIEELADVESGVGVLIVADALLRSGYQPSRTLVFSIMLGKASDAKKVSEYLHATYGLRGLNMEFDPPVFACREKESFISEASRVIGDLFPKGPWPFDHDLPRIIRYSFNPALSQARLTRLRLQAVDAWLRLILSADWN